MGNRRERREDKRRQRRTGQQEGRRSARRWMERDWPCDNLTSGRQPLPLCAWFSLEARRGRREDGQMGRRAASAFSILPRPYPRPTPSTALLVVASNTHGPPSESPVDPLSTHTKVWGAAAAGGRVPWGRGSHPPPPTPVHRVTPLSPVSAQSSLRAGHSAKSVIRWWVTTPGPSGKNASLLWLHSKCICW